MTSTDKLLPQLTKPQTENSDVGAEPKLDIGLFTYHTSAANRRFELFRTPLRLCAE